MSSAIREEGSNIRQDMLDVLERQRRAYLAEGDVTAETRIDRLRRAIDLLKKHGDRLCEAMDADFGHRSKDQSKLTDINGSIGPLNHAIRHVRQFHRFWLRLIWCPYRCWLRPVLCI